MTTLLQALINELPKRDRHRDNSPAQYEDWCLLPAGYTIEDVQALLVMLGADKDGDGDAVYTSHAHRLMLLTNTSLTDSDDDYVLNAVNIEIFLRAKGVL